MEAVYQMKLVDGQKILLVFKRSLVDTLTYIARNIRGITFAHLKGFITEILSQRIF